MKSLNIKKTAAVAVLVIIGAVVVFGAWCLYCGISVSLEAEKTLGAYRMVLDRVSVYVEKTSGQWPRSWDDLRPLSPSKESHGWKWPRDIEEIQRRIRIDFSVTCAEVAKQDPENFHAIEQIGPNFGSYHSHFLLEVCNKYGEGHSDNRGKKHSAD
jgi:hypothetical protein